VQIKVDDDCSFDIMLQISYESVVDVPRRRWSWPTVEGTDDYIVDVAEAGREPHPNQVALREERTQMACLLHSDDLVGGWRKMPC
jgi:hypothetical protein